MTFAGRDVAAASFVIEMLEVFEARIARSGSFASTKVINTAQLACTFGAAPSVLTVAPTHFTMTTNQPQANIMDFVPNENIIPGSP